MPHLRDFYYKDLGEIFDISYVKEGKKLGFCNQLYQRLQSDPNASQEKAINRAKKLLADKIHLPYHQQNPVTTVFELVELL